MLGMLVLMLSSILMIIISKTTNLFVIFPIIEIIFTHTAIFVFSILLILTVNKGKFRGYGFVWSLTLPILKIILVSLMLGFMSFIIKKLLPESVAIHPASSFSTIEKIMFVWVWASISEEILTRGLIQSFLSPMKHFGILIFNKFISIPVIVGAIFFGLMHFTLLTMGMNIFIVSNIVIFGMLLGLIAGYHREKTNSLVPAILVHFSFNVGASIFSLFQLQMFLL